MCAAYSNLPFAMNPVRILVIEDSMEDAALIKELTSRSTVPVEVTIAPDADKALAALNQSPAKPDLIIADMNLPRLSADEFVARHGSQGVPWVVFSSSQDPAKIKRALELGALEYVEKPLDLDAFAEALWAIIWKWTIKTR